MIAIIEGCGANISSVQFALERLNKKAILTSDSALIRNADYVILPGVGTAKQAMDKLNSLGLIEIIKNLQQPVLGICLGMQLLYAFSEEGNVNGLGILPGNIQLFPKIAELVTPHMGWNKLLINPESSSPLLQDIENDEYVYYVHSYFAPVSVHTKAMTQYGELFSGVVEHNNFYGVQFHPERSGAIGEKILQNFLGIHT
jgi:glutamine amidotransferase